ncbi:hypothetical protein K474DRAFT_1668098 [Panus rudis PR-1116 ss-1]|nr:hypothetical protein K474DRAFT_1668098 [Panus rudis PR-1116 ss-1]
MLSKRIIVRPQAGLNKASSPARGMNTHSHRSLVQMGPVLFTFFHISKFIEAPTFVNTQPTGPMNHRPSPLSEEGYRALYRQGLLQREISILQGTAKLQPERNMLPSTQLKDADSLAMSKTREAKCDGLQETNELFRGGYHIRILYAREGAQGRVGQSWTRRERFDAYDEREGKRARGRS